MANMSYCRFENTVKDLRDCADHIDNQLEAGGYEDKSRVKLIKIAYDMLQQFMEVVDGEITLDMDGVNDLPVERD